MTPQINKDIIRILEEEPEMVLAMIQGNPFPAMHLVKCMRGPEDGRVFEYFLREILIHSFYKKDL